VPCRKNLFVIIGQDAGQGVIAEVLTANILTGR